MKCPACGTENADDLTYCLSCGHKLKDTPPIDLDRFVTSLTPKEKSKKAVWPIWLTALFAIASAIVLFLNRVRVMEFLYQNIPVLRNNIEFADEIWPMILLLIPWVVLALIVFLLFRIIARLFGKRAQKKGHPVLKAILVIIILAAIFVFFCNYFNPGFVQSIPEWINQTIHQLTAPQETASGCTQTAKFVMLSRTFTMM